jgi:hypothetical protein
MAEFQNLPSRVQDAVQSQLAENEQIQLCILGRADFLSPDFVIITSDRVMVVDERSMGSLNLSYANIRCNLRFPQIKNIKLERHLTHWIFGQACLEIEIARNRYLINNLNYRDARRALKLITSQIADDPSPLRCQHDRFPD